MSMNQHARKSRLRDRLAKREVLLGAAPEIFNLMAPKLLHSSVSGQLQEKTGIGRGTVNQFLIWWTSKPEYLKVLADPSSVYYDIYGRPHGFVTMQHVMKAQDKLEALRLERARKESLKATKTGRVSARATSTSNKPRSGEGGNHRKSHKAGGGQNKPKISYKRRKFTESKEK
jgi:sRNA-binding protein